MRIRFLVLMLCVLFFGTGNRCAYASHIAAVNITYLGINDSTYVITIKYYRDCTAGAFLASTVNYNYSSVSCGLSGSSVLDLITGDSTGSVSTGNFVDLPCSGVDTCDASLGLYSIEEFVYVDTLILSTPCNDWMIESTTSGLRNNNDVILVANEKIYVAALINNLDAPGNKSPDFIKPPVAIFCTGRDFFFNQGAVEPDGDSLVYSLVQAQGEFGAILPYVTGYTAQYPFNTVDDTLIMEPNTGVITFTPDTPALSSVLSVLIEEYNSNNVLIGSIKNDMQVIINDSCTSDTLTFLGDTTTATETHPAISASCLDISITIHFDNPIQCETVSLDGSDFIITSPIGDTVPIAQIVDTGCVGGLVDSLVLILTDSMRFNGSYHIYDVVGTDFIPILSECGLRLNDTLEIRLRNCVKASVNLLNVSVVNNSYIDIIWSKSTENFQDAYFYRYDVYRSLDPSFGYDSIASIFSIDDTTFSDFGVTVSNTAYNYMIKMILDPNLLLAPESDTIASILLQSTRDIVDTNIQNLVWSRYWGWESAQYEVLESTNGAIWKTVGSALPADTDYVYTDSLLASSYRLMIGSTESFGGFETVSNWIEFVVPVEAIPNVITPNGDGINDFFFINEILLYAPVDLVIYNRWGMEVFEKDDYQNNWDGDNFSSKPLVPGTYYYLLKLTGADDRAGFITIIR